MESPYQVKLDRPQFNYDSNNKKEFQVVLNVDYKLKGNVIKDMLKSLPYSGLKQDGSLTVFYFNKDKYNFPADISKKIQLGEYRTIPVIQLQDSNQRPLVVIVDTADKALHDLTSNKITKTTDIFISKFEPGDFLSTHNDTNLGRYAFIIYLNEILKIIVNYLMKLIIHKY